MTELAHRNQNGLDVTLESVGDRLLVTVKDGVDSLYNEEDDAIVTPNEFVLETTNGKQALDMYYHPFAYYRDRLS